ncbi:integral membrane protein [Colletotrichum incanum]|uniref:Integral membrane protein n=1 Tax=Colletotrichum incanum TaxID=1573173 RepID=A0A162P0R0_COLIC|nr:integral membrane protein [Colletotrichum incanum]
MLIWSNPEKEDMDSFPDSIGGRIGAVGTNLPENSYESLVDLILGVTVALLVVATIFVALRVYVRAIVIKKWRVDDTLLVLSFLAVLLHDVMMCLANQVLQAKGTRFGLGKHVWMTPLKTIIKGQKVAMLIIILYNVAFITIKITFLLQYRRVFPLPRIELLCNIGIAFLALFGISLLVSAGITYNLVFSNNYWNSPINILGWWLANASIHLVTDILIFILPLPLLGRLRLHKPQKLALIASFALGFFTCAISIIRIVSLPGSFDTIDQTYESAPTVIWTIAELSSALICCCIPTLRPLVQRSRYLPGGSAFSGNSFSSTPRSRPNLPQHNDRISSSISCASDTAIRKPKPSFSWKRSRQRSEQSTIAGVDDIEPMPATSMEPVAPMMPATPVVVAMPTVEVNGVRRESGGTIDNGGTSQRRNSIRSSAYSDVSLGAGDGSVRRDLSVRRHMSIALTERDSDDDVYYFGVREEDVDMECPTPLSPPPKFREPTSLT